MEDQYSIRFAFFYSLVFDLSTGGVKGYVSPILKLVLLNQDEDKSNSPEVPVSPSNFTSSTLVQ